MLINANLKPDIKNKLLEEAVYTTEKLGNMSTNSVKR